MPPAARVTDNHTCPMVTGVVPHVGGPILPPGGITVLIGMLPAARVGDMLTCVGPPDVIAKGSATVLIGNMPAARMGDMTVHGGVIILGCPTVMIGDSGGGGGGGPDWLTEIVKGIEAEDLNLLLKIGAYGTVLLVKKFAPVLVDKIGVATLDNTAIAVANAVDSAFAGGAIGTVVEFAERKREGKPLFSNDAWVDYGETLVTGTIETGIATSVVSAFGLTGAVAVVANIAIPVVLAVAVYELFKPTEVS